MPVVQDEISLVKVENGGDGRGILGTPVATYAQSTSGTIPPTTWSATRPNVPAGQYLWTRVVTTYTDNSTSETQTPTLMGKEGTSGLGIKTKSISYAVGTSGNTPPTNGWQETIPIVSANQYLWTKTTLVYTDDSKTDAYSVGKMGADGANAKLLYLTASAENMAFNADDIPKTTQTINISAKLQNVTGTAMFTAIPYIGNTAQTAITLGGTGNTRTLTSAHWTNKEWTLIAITATLDNLSDTLSIVKVKDGKEGETFYPHPAWMMADGTFTKVYPNENLLSISRFEKTASREFVNDSRWDLAPIFEKYGIGIEYTISFDLKSAVSGPIQVYSQNGSGTKYNIGTSTVQATTEYKRYSVTVTPQLQTGTTMTQALLAFYGVYDSGRIPSIKNVKVELGNLSTLDIPSPNENYSEAYPKYEGFYSDTNPVGSDNKDDYKPWTPFMGPQGGQGPKGDSVPLISLSGATQAITVDKDGKITPASSFTVTGTAVNTTISNWTYSLNGGNFGSAVPTGVARSGNTVTINPVTAIFDQLTIRAADAAVSDVYTISRIKDGSTGLNGADAYTVFLTNESYTFAGSTDAALAGSTTTEVVVYKGINKITPTSVVVGTKPTGLSSSVSGSVITFAAATTLITKSGIVPLTITADGKTFTKQFAYAISFQGGKGEPGQNGVSVTGTQVQYVQSSSMTEPTTGWSATRPTPVSGQWLWTRSRSIFSDGTYGSWATVPTLIGREAIVVSDTAPSNPSKGTLWQKTNDPKVQQWDGTKWVDWGIAPENLVVENAVIENGRFEILEGVTVKAGTVDGGKFTSSFQRDIWSGSAQAKKGEIVIQGGYIDLKYDLIQKSNNAVLSKGGHTLDENGLIIFTDDVNGNRQKTTAYTDTGIIMSDASMASYGDVNLKYQDLMTVPKTLLSASTGFSQYATSGDNAPMVERSGRNVRLSGAFKNNSELPINADMVMGVLPVWARPTSLVVQRQQASFNNGYLLNVRTDGTITMSRHAAGANNVAVPAGSWLNIAVGFSAENF